MIIYSWLISLTFSPFHFLSCTRQKFTFLLKTSTNPGSYLSMFLHSIYTYPMHSNVNLTKHLDAFPTQLTSRMLGRHFYMTDATATTPAVQLVPVTSSFKLSPTRLHSVLDSYFFDKFHDSYRHNSIISRLVRHTWGNCRGILNNPSTEHLFIPTC